MDSQLKPNAVWRSTYRPQTQVTIVQPSVEIRVGEGMRKAGVVYERGGKLFARNRVEFLAKFEPVVVEEAPKK